MAWQPIQTAPQDDTRILIYDPKSSPNVCEAIMMPDFTYKDPTYDEWFSKTKATHWQHLPKPPTESE